MQDVVLGWGPGAAFVCTENLCQSWWSWWRVPGTYLLTCLLI